MPKLASIGSHGQNQALQAHVWVKNGPKTAEARPDWHHRDRIGIRLRPSYVRTDRVVAVNLVRARTPAGQAMGQAVIVHTPKI